MGRKHLTATIAVVVAAIVATVIWAGSLAADPNGPPPADAGGDRNASANTPADDSKPTVAAEDQRPRPADDPAAEDSTTTIPVVEVGDCAQIKTAILSYQEAGAGANPADFRVLLRGLEILAGNIESLSGADQTYLPVVHGISDVRRLWSTSLSAYDDGLSEEAKKSAGEGVSTLKDLDKGLVCS